MRSPQRQDPLEHRRHGTSSASLTARSKSAIAVTILITLAVAATFRIYALSEFSGGFALWNASEAFIFMQVDDRGYNANLLQYPWILFKAYVIGGFAAVELPKDERAELIVMRVTALGVERHVVKLDRTEEGGPGGDPGKYTPLEGRIYAYCPWVIGHFMQDGQLVGNSMDDALCWWAGDHFEKANIEERRRLDGVKRLTMGDYGNDENGWSRREVGAGHDNLQYTIDVGNKLRLVMNNVTTGLEHSTFSIELRRTGKVSERIGSFFAREGRVSTAEYQQVFHK
jgi:hypothetical protein